MYVDVLSTPLLFDDSHGVPCAVSDLACRLPYASEFSTEMLSIPKSSIQTKCTHALTYVNAFDKKGSLRAIHVLHGLCFSLTIKSCDAFESLCSAVTSPSPYSHNAPASSSPQDSPTPQATATESTRSRGLKLAKASSLSTGLRNSIVLTSCTWRP